MALLLLLQLWDITYCGCQLACGIPSAVDASTARNTANSRIAEQFSLYCMSNDTKRLNDKFLLMLHDDSDPIR